MGEYIHIINLTKRELVAIVPYKFCEYMCNAHSKVLFWLCTLRTPKDLRGLGWGEVDGYKTLGRWAGDRVIVLGDYHPDYDKYRDFKDISIEVLEEVIDYLEKDGNRDEAEFLKKSLEIMKE